MPIKNSHWYIQNLFDDRNNKKVVLIGKCEQQKITNFYTLSCLIYFIIVI